MKIIVITPEEIYDGEEKLIATVLSVGADRVHLRKPHATAEQTSALIERIPPSLRARISLHDHHALAERYGIGGIHLNGRNPVPPEGFSGKISRSCHSIGELRDCDRYDYMFLSPIFDSISKEGYASAFSAEELGKARDVIAERTVALGGIRPEHLPYLADAGFVGAAFLGYVWQTREQKDVVSRMEEIMRYCGNLS